MGRLTSNRRGDDWLSPNCEFASLNSQNFHVSKRPRLSFTKQSPDQMVLLSKSAVSRVFQYPEAKSPLSRLHAPCRTSKFGFNPNSLKRGCSPKPNGDVMGILLSRLNKAKISAFGTFRYVEKEKEVIELDKEVENGGVSEDSIIEQIEVIDEDERSGKVYWCLPDVVELDAKSLDCGAKPSSSSVVSDLTNASAKVEDTVKKFDSLVIIDDVDVSTVSAYKNLLERVERQRTPRLKTLDFDIELLERRRSFLQSLRPKKKPVEEAPPEPFIPLTEKEEALVKQALSSANRRKVLVAHKNSNIEITGDVLQCLRPGAWLNDEVINVYLELLKERENREPQKFLKCHFFNTFFYKKLISGSGYDYKSVRRWTSQRKLGYGLVKCDKIFVPVHKEIHWCLAVINKKEKKFQYLDSLKGRDNKIMDVLARYYVDEVKDKSGEDINVSSWEREYVEDLPEQENGYDCGVFMIKYADFYSRGLPLFFNQEHMPYFRWRTAKEILKLRAD